MWEEYDQVLKTLLHEFRHAMQHKRDILYVGSERYEERWIEKMRGSSRRGNWMNIRVEG